MPDNEGTGGGIAAEDITIPGSKIADPGGGNAGTMSDDMKEGMYNSGAVVAGIGAALYGGGVAMGLSPYGKTAVGVTSAVVTMFSGAGLMLTGFYIVVSAAAANMDSEDDAATQSNSKSSTAHNGGRTRSESASWDTGESESFLERYRPGLEGPVGLESPIGITGTADPLSVAGNDAARSLHALFELTLEVRGGIRRARLAFKHQDYRAMRFQQQAASDAMNAVYVQNARAAVALEDLAVAAQQYPELTTRYPVSAILGGLRLDEPMLEFGRQLGLADEFSRSLATKAQRRLDARALPDELSYSDAVALAAIAVRIANFRRASQFDAFPFLLEAR